MTTETFTCKECGTVTTYEYDGCGSYSQMFSEREWVEVRCKNRDCNAVVATVVEY